MTIDCSWDNPGADPFRTRGDIAAAIASYGYPGELVRRIRRIEPDDVVYISRDRVVALKGNAAEIRDMWFGKDRMCSGPVQRSAWPADRLEPALVYCHAARCVAVPMVCGNVVKIDWTPKARRDPEFNAWQHHAQTNTVPEPSSLLLAALGVAGVVVAGRGRR